MDRGDAAYRREMICWHHIRGFAQSGGRNYRLGKICPGSDSSVWGHRDHCSAPGRGHRARTIRAHRANKSEVPRKSGPIPIGHEAKVMSSASDCSILSNWSNGSRPSRSS